MLKRVVVASVFAFLFLLSFTSASIMFTEPKNLYSIGDELSLNVTLQPAQATNGFFVATLRCDSREVEIYRMPYDSKAGQFHSFSIKATLDKSLIGSLQGESCYVEGKYGAERSVSSEFEISSEVVVSLDIQGNVFEPTDSVTVSGSAFLENGLPANGIVVLTISKTTLEFDSTVQDGKFNYTFALPRAMPSGGYVLTATVSHRDNLGNTLNTGNMSETFKVKQVIQEVEVALSNVSVRPGTELRYNVVLYDQSLIKAIQEVSVRLLNPSGVLVDEKTISSGTDTNYFTIGTSYQPGTWTVQASVAGLTGNRSFLVTELKNIQVIRENATLVVINTGNVVYDLPLEVLVGDTPQTFPLNLQVGEEKRLKIFAPDGEYAIGVNSGSDSLVLGTAFLTGNAIKISDLSEVNVARMKAILWTILVIALGVFVYRQYRKFRKNREFISPSSASSASMRTEKSSMLKEDESFMWKTSSKVPETKSFSEIQRKNKLIAVDDFGKKEEATVIALKIKNYDEIAKYKGTESALDTLVRAAGLARSAKAQVSREDKFTVMIFSQTGTGDKNVHFKAVKVAKEIENLLKAHNRKYARKISFGIGAATGEMVVEKRGSEVMHTAVGTLIPTAKKIAEHAHDVLLLHNSTHNKLRGQIKVDKGIGGLHWTVQSFIEREQHNQFIKKFMERRADESKSF